MGRRRSWPWPPPSTSKQDPPVQILLLVCSVFSVVIMVEMATFTGVIWGWWEDFVGNRSFWAAEICDLELGTLMDQIRSNHDEEEEKRNFFRV